MKGFNEKSLVEDYIIEELSKEGWNFVTSDTLGRSSNNEAIIEPLLIGQLSTINSKKNPGSDETIQVVNELKLMAHGQNSSKRFLNYLKYGVPIKFEKERIVQYLQLVDYENVQNNDFTISRQVTNTNGDNWIRNDILLYVNGIPLVNIECKSPVRRAESWRNAYTEIKDFEHLVPELYKYVQIGVAAREIAKYFAIVPWQEEVEKMEWKVKGEDSIDSVIEMLSPDTLLNFLKNYVFTSIEHGSSSKVIARYMQYRAVEKIFNRIMSYNRGSGDKNKGLIWQWQGSGKTLEMIFAAIKLHTAPEMENPSIFLVVDRVDLEDQLFDAFAAMDVPKPEVIGTVSELKTALSFDNWKGKRGLLITLIHKFRPEELSGLMVELESVERETIMNRRNVVTLIDEGHRTQYGNLAGQMRAILKSASSYAFTGTPISKTGRDTFSEFSYPPEEPYLDKYFIAESLADGYTVKIAYQPRLENDVHLNKQMLDTFLDVELEEIPEEYRETTESNIKRKMNEIKVVLENPERIRRVAEDIAKHFKENLDGKYKGMVVAISRKACVLYKKYLDEFLPSEYSEVIMTLDTRDTNNQLAAFAREVSQKYKGKEFEAVRKELKTKFKEEPYPKIFIVTDMLLTGFNAPVLQTMYLDKPLKEHRLLQAIARTNRPYKGTKDAGLIVDYVGVLGRLVDALKNYSRADIKEAAYNIDDLVKEFSDSTEDLLSIFSAIPKDNFDRTTMLDAFETITSDEKIETRFVEGYRRLRKRFELLGTDSVKLERLKDYKWLSAVYTYYKVTVNMDDKEDGGHTDILFEKTLKYVYRSTELSDFRQDLPTIQFDSDYLEKLDAKVKNEREKAANLVFTLNRLVLVERAKNPVYESLSERVENILKLWREKTRDYERIYSAGSGIIREINDMQKRQHELGFTDIQYSILLCIEENTGKSPVDDIKELFGELKQFMYRNWTLQKSARQDVERTVRTFLRGKLKDYGLEFKDLDPVFGAMMERVYEYGSRS